MRESRGERELKRGREDKIELAKKLSLNFLLFFSFTLLLLFPLPSLKVNVGKSTLLNRIIPRLESELKQNLSALTTSPLPGTTIRPISFKFSRSGKLYDTPGIPNLNQIFRFLTPREVCAVLPSGKVWPKKIRLTSGKVPIFTLQFSLTVPLSFLLFFHFFSFSPSLFSSLSLDHFTSHPQSLTFSLLHQHFLPSSPHPSPPLDSLPWRPCSN